MADVYPCNSKLRDKIHTEKLININLWLLVESSDIPTNNLLNTCERIFFKDCPEQTQLSVQQYLMKMDMSRLIYMYNSHHVIFASSQGHYRSRTFAAS